MSWLTPRDWVTGEIVTSTIMNQHVRDQLKAMAQTASKPAVRLRNSAGVATVSGTSKVIPFDTENYDIAGEHSTVSNTERITMSIAGRRSCGGTLEFASNATGYRQALIRVNGSLTIAQQLVPAINGQVTVLSVTTGYHFSVNDYIELLAVQTSTVGLNVDSISDYSPVMWCELQSYD